MSVMNIAIAYDFIKFNGKDITDLMMAKLKDKLVKNGVEVNKMEKIDSREKLEDAIRMRRFDIVFVSEKRGDEDAVGAGTIKSWKAMNPNVNIVMICNNERVGATKFITIYEKAGFKNVIFEKDFYAENCTKLLDCIYDRVTDEDYVKYCEITLIERKEVVKEEKKAEQPIIKEETVKEEPKVEIKEEPKAPEVLEEKKEEPKKETFDDDSFDDSEYEGLDLEPEVVTETKAEEVKEEQPKMESFDIFGGMGNLQYEKAAEVTQEEAQEEVKEEIIEETVETSFGNIFGDVQYEKALEVEQTGAVELKEEVAEEVKEPQAESIDVFAGFGNVEYEKAEEVQQEVAEGATEEVITEEVIAEETVEEIKEVLEEKEEVVQEEVEEAEFKEIPVDEPKEEVIEEVGSEEIPEVIEEKITEDKEAEKETSYIKEETQTEKALEEPEKVVQEEPEKEEKTEPKREDSDKNVNNNKEPWREGKKGKREIVEGKIQTFLTNEELIIQLFDCKNTHVIDFAHEYVFNILLDLYEANGEKTQILIKTSGSQKMDKKRVICRIPGGCIGGIEGRRCQLVITKK